MITRTEHSEESGATKAVRDPILPLKPQEFAREGSRKRFKGFGNALACGEAARKGAL